MQTFDLAIIGGGILGIAHAYHALAAGLRVAVIEKDARPTSATVRNFGQIVPSGMDAKWQRYGRRSLEIYRSLQEQADISVRPYGSVYLAANEEEMTLLEELAEINRANDYTSRMLTKSECLAQYPGLRASYVQGGLFFPAEITVDPQVAIHQITDLLKEQYQLAYFPLTLVTAIEGRAGNYSLVNNRRLVLQAAQVIVCSGSDFQTLFPEIFQSSGLQSVKLQMLQTRPQAVLRIPGSVLTGWTIRRYESFQECPSYAAIKAKEDPEAFHRKWGIHILFKQNPDGSIILGDSHEYWDADASETVDFKMDGAINRFMVDAAADIFELETYELHKSWMGVYSQCKDRDVFEAEVLPGLRIVTGIGGKGMTGSFGYAEERIGEWLG